jgi:hypothetical protein
VGLPEDSLSPPIGAKSSFLRIPNLKNNSFSYSIPRELDRLSRLQQLAWGNNTFISDEIPVNIFFLLLLLTWVSGPVYVQLIS